MPKSYKYALYLIGFFVILALLYALAASFFSKPPSSSQSPNPAPSSTATSTSALPDELLSQDQEAQVRQFVENFVILYNSYTYGDYSNLTALGDYQTPQMQQQTLDLVNELRTSTPIGFSQQTKVSDQSFSYHYPEASQLFVTLKGTEIKNTGQVNISILVELQKAGNSWLVNNLTITNN